MNDVKDHKLGESSKTSTMHVYGASEVSEKSLLAKVSIDYYPHLVEEELVESVVQAVANQLGDYISATALIKKHGEKTQ